MPVVPLPACLVPPIPAVLRVVGELEGVDLSACLPGGWELFEPTAPNADPRRANVLLGRPSALEGADLSVARGAISPIRVALCGDEDEIRAALEAGMEEARPIALSAQTLRQVLIRAHALYGERVEADASRRALGLVSDVVVAVGDRRRVISYNEGAQRVFNRSVDEVMGKKADAFLNLPAAAGSCEEEPCDFPFQHPGLQPGSVRGRRAVIRMGDGRVIGQVLVARDLSLDQQIRRMVLRASALADLGLKAAEIAHDIGSPLTVISSNLDLLARDRLVGRLSEDRVADLLGDCKASVHMISGVIQPLRRAARWMQVEPPALVSVVECFTKAMNDLRGRLGEPEPLVQIAGDPEITAFFSPSDLSRVLSNLIINAAQAQRGQRTPPAQVHLSVEAQDSELCVEVRDQGPGVPPELAEAIFRPFFTTKAETEGTGLGLALCRELVEQHEGRLELAPPGGRGACFRIRLPRVVAP